MTWDLRVSFGKDGASIAVRLVTRTRTACGHEHDHDCRTPAQRSDVTREPELGAWAWLELARVLLQEPG